MVDRKGSEHLMRRSDREESCLPAADDRSYRTETVDSGRHRSETMWRWNSFHWDALGMKGDSNVSRESNGRDGL